MSGESFADRSDRIERARAALKDEARTEPVARQHKRGKQTARERLACLFDEDRFEEFGGLVHEQHGSREDYPADGVICGVGRIDGRWVGVWAQDFTVMGGSVGPLGSSKMQRVIDQCMTQGLPLVMLIDSGGHRVQGGQDSWHFARTGRFFHDLVRLSGWVPMVAAVMGDGFAAGTNFAGVADFVIMVRGTATMGLSGPLLVKAATGEEITKEELGGADVQVDQNGLAHMGVDSEAEALDAVKRYLSYLPSSAQAPATIGPRDDPADRPCEAAASLVPVDSRKPYDVRKVIREVADQASVFEVQPTWGASAVTAFARMGGRAVGFVANQPMRLGGMLTAPACEKIAHFVAVCDAFGLPLIYLIDVPGFSIGTSAEKSMLGRRSARMVYEIGHATVPRISVVLRKGYGMGYVAMCGGRGFDVDAALAWPTAEICPMSIEGSVDVVYRKDYEQAPDPAARRQELINEMRAMIDPLRAAGGFGIDDLIEPADTRRRLNDILSRAGTRRAVPMPPKVRSISPI
jgi:acetyl-CoA carboxylase carboxyltransferase component